MRTHSYLYPPTQDYLRLPFRAHVHRSIVICRERVYKGIYMVAYKTNSDHYQHSDSDGSCVKSIRVTVTKGLHVTGLTCLVDFEAQGYTK